MQEVKYKSLKWLNLVSPTKEQFDMLKKRYRFHELDLEDCLQEFHRPKIDEYEKYLFIILQFPTRNTRHQRFETEQLNMFIGQNYLITLHNGNLKIIDDIITRCQKSIKYRREMFGASTGYLLYELILALFSEFFPITDSIQLSLKKLEMDIFDSDQPKDELFSIMVLKKNIITLRKIILPQRPVIAALEHKQKRFLPENLVIYFDDVVDQIERVWNLLETQKEIVESLEDTNESLISHNINATIKTLTVFSVIMLPLTFLTGLFGMNVGLPFSATVEGMEHFWKILISMGLLATAMVLYFKWKKWI